MFRGCGHVFSMTQTASYISVWKVFITSHQNRKFKKERTKSLLFQTIESEHIALTFINSNNNFRCNGGLNCCPNKTLLIYLEFFHGRLELNNSSDHVSAGQEYQWDDGWGADQAPGGAGDTEAEPAEGGERGEGAETSSRKCKFGSSATTERISSISSLHSRFWVGLEHDGDKFFKEYDGVVK